MRTVPSSPAGFFDPHRDMFVLTHEERSAVRARVLSLPHLLLAVFFLSGTACTAAVVNLTADPVLDHKQEYAAIAESVFRHQMAAHLAHADDVFCLAFQGGADPTASFLTRFDDVAQPVVPISQCAQHGARREDRLFLSVDNVRWQPRNRVQVSGDAGGAVLYTVDYKAGDWLVRGALPLQPLYR